MIHEILFQEVTYQYDDVADTISVSGAAAAPPSLSEREMLTILGLHPESSEDAVSEESATLVAVLADLAAVRVGLRNALADGVVSSTEVNSLRAPVVAALSRLSEVLNEETDAAHSGLLVVANICQALLTLIDTLFTGVQALSIASNDHDQRLIALETP